MEKKNEEAINQSSPCALSARTHPQLLSHEHLEVSEHRRRVHFRGGCHHGDESAAWELAAAAMVAGFVWSCLCRAGESERQRAREWRFGRSDREPGVHERGRSSSRRKRERVGSRTVILSRNKKTGSFSKKKKKTPLASTIETPSLSLSKKTNIVATLPPLCRPHHSPA